MATGPEGSEAPIAHALPAWDAIAGGMVVQGLLAAERHRLRHGAGQAVDLTLKDVAAAMLGHLGLIGEHALTGQTRGRAGNSLYGAYGQDFLCADGARVMVIGLTARQWQNLLKITGTAEAMEALAAAMGADFRDEGARWQARHAITAVLAPWFAARRLADFAGDFDRAGVTWSVFRTFAESIEHDPDLSLDNPIFAEVDQPGIGRYRSPGSPLSFATIAREPAAPAPLLGQHTEAVLADVAGLSSGTIGRLFDEGIVAQPGRDRLRRAC